MRAAMIAMVGLVTVASAAPKAVDPIKAATNAMAEADFDKALAVLDAALPKASKPAEVAQLQLMRGEALVALQRLDEATVAFSAALAADPSAELPASSASPDAVNAMAKARRLIMSDLSIVIGMGAKANVKLDDTELGPAPLKTRVGAGRHRLEAVGDDGQRVAREIEIAPGKPMEVTLVLPPPLEALPPPPPPPPPELAAIRPPEVEGAPSKSGSKLGLGPLIGGAAVVAAGVGCLVAAGGNHQQLVDPTGPRLDGPTESRLASDGSTLQTLGVAGLAVGSAAVATGAVMLFLMRGRSEKSVQVTGLASPTGAWLGLAGTFEETR